MLWPFVTLLCLVLSHMQTVTQLMHTASVFTFFHTIFIACRMGRVQQLEGLWNTFRARYVNMAHGSVFHSLKNKSSLVINPVSSRCCSHLEVQEPWSALCHQLSVFKATGYPSLSRAYSCNALGTIVT